MYIPKWVQVGDDIDGENALDESGVAVALSSNGAVVAIGAYLNDGAGDQSGHVRVYTQSGGGGWAQRGSDLDGPGPRSSSGWAVAMSADGTIVAVGAVSASQVNVFIWNGSAWEGMGQTIFGDGVGDGFGVSVALSDDGSIMTAGAFRRSSGQAGHVRVFAWTGADWNQRGNNLVGFPSSDAFGHRVSLSSDGSIVASGAQGERNSVGYVRIFQWSGSSWLEQAQTLRGPDSFFGSTVSLSGDGRMLAVGAQSRSYVMMFRNDGTGWFQIGSTIHGAAARDLFGISVSLSHDGETVVIGGNKNDSNGVDSGHALVYRLLAPNRDEWIRVGQELVGEAANDNFGRSAAISDNGNRIAIGAQWNSGNGVIAGHVRVYDLQ